MHIQILFTKINVQHGKNVGVSEADPVGDLALGQFRGFDGFGEHVCSGADNHGASPIDVCLLICLDSQRANIRVADCLTWAPEAPPELCRVHPNKGRTNEAKI